MYVLQHFIFLFSSSSSCIPINQSKKTRRYYSGISFYRCCLCRYCFLLFFLINRQNELYQKISSMNSVRERFNVNNTVKWQQNYALNTVDNRCGSSHCLKIFFFCLKNAFIQATLFSQMVGMWHSSFFFLLFFTHFHSYMYFIQKISPKKKETELNRNSL